MGCFQPEWILPGRDGGLQSEAVETDELAYDKLNVVISPNACRTADPRTGRGVPRVWKSGSFRLRWMDGIDVGVAVRLHPGDIDGAFRVEWSPSRVVADDCEEDGSSFWTVGSPWTAWY